jgi:hypothetical protein
MSTASLFHRWSGENPSYSAMLSIVELVPLRESFPTNFGNWMELIPQCSTSRNGMTAPSFKQFIHLRSLTVSSLHSYSTLLKLLDECYHLNNLTRLNFYFSSFSNIEANYQPIVDNICKLPRLTHFYCSIAIKERHLFCMPTSISSSLKYECISTIELKWNQIYQLFHHTARLKHLSTSIASFTTEDYVKSPISK